MRIRQPKRVFNLRYLIPCFVLLFLINSLYLRSKGDISLISTGETQQQLNRPGDPCERSLKCQNASILFKTNLQFESILIITCSYEFPVKRPRTAPQYVFQHIFNLQPRIVLNKDDNNEIIPSSWSVWSACGTGLGDRKIPLLTENVIIKDGLPLVFNLPGKCSFAGKSGLWNGLVNYLGVEKASEICPMTFVQPFQQMDKVETYLKTLKGSEQIVFKTGHRQRQVRIFQSEQIKEILEYIQDRHPSIGQLFKPSIKKLDLQTAFRTYVWIRCIQPSKAIALIDWRSPAYVATTKTDFVASGYSKSNYQYDAFELLSELYEMDLYKAISHIEQKVGVFLNAFQQSMCASSKITSASYYENFLIMEQFGFDWIPSRNSETNEPEVWLLETNRFTDLSLHSLNQDHELGNEKKDWLKICTIVRRLGKAFSSSSSTLNKFLKCFEPENIRESIVLPS